MPHGGSEFPASFFNVGFPGEPTVDCNSKVFAFAPEMQFLLIQGEATASVPLVAYREDYDLGRRTPDLHLRYFK